MRDAALHRLARSVNTAERLFHQSLVADVGEKASFLFAADGMACDLFQNRRTQFVNAIAGYGRRAEYFHLGLDRAGHQAQDQTY